MKGITQLYSNMSPSVIKLICARILNSNDSIRGIAKTARVSASTVNRFKRRLDELNIKDYQEIAELRNCEIFLPFFNFLKNITFWCQSTQENVYGTNKQCCSH